MGLGLSAAIGAAFEPTSTGRGPCDVTYCDLNGERHRTEEWGFTLMREAQLTGDPAFITPVDSCGDVGAASGPLNCALAIEAWRRAYAPGPRALVWGSSDGGRRAATILERTDTNTAE